MPPVVLGESGFSSLKCWFMLSKTFFRQVMKITFSGYNDQGGWNKCVCYVDDLKFHVLNNVTVFYIYFILALQTPETFLILITLHNNISVSGT